MSYVVHLWEQPIPASLEEASDVLDGLLDAPERPGGPKMEALRQALWNRYPRDLSNDDEDPVWADTVLSSGQQAKAVESLGVVTSHLDEVMPFIIRTAKDLGLVLYDEQYGSVFLPSGQVLGNVPPAVGKPAAKRFDQTDAEHALVQVLKPVLAAEGFIWRKVRTYMRFVREFEGGGHSITVVADDTSRGAELDLLVETHLDVVDTVVKPLSSRKASNPSRPYTRPWGGFFELWMPKRHREW